MRETSSNCNLTPYPPKLGMTKAMQSVSSIQNYLKVDIAIVVIGFRTGIFTSFKKNLLVYIYIIYKSSLKPIGMGSIR
jgi:hypothetical protein